jgi:hypothetical protein
MNPMHLPDYWQGKGQKIGGHQTPNREAIERVASELALIDHYDPNQANPDNWSAIAREYEARAERIIAALERAT